MKILFQIILLIVTVNSFSQNLSLDKILTLRKKDLATVEEYLTTRDWEFLSAEKATANTMGTVQFAYKKDSYNDKAHGFLTYLYTDSSNYKRITLQISKLKYQSYLDRIRSFGCKIVDSEITNDAIKKTYQGTTTTFIINISTQLNDYNTTSAVYHILILDNSDYIENLYKGEPACQH